MTHEARMLQGWVKTWSMHDTYVTAVMHGNGIGVTYQSTMAEWKLSSQVKTQSTYDTEVTYVTGVMCDTRVMYQSGLSENHRLKTHGSHMLQESHMTQELHMEYFWHMKHALHRSYVWILHEWRKNHIKHKKYKEIHMTQETRWHMRAPEAHGSEIYWKHWWHKKHTKHIEHLQHLSQLLVMKNI